MIHASHPVVNTRTTLTMDIDNPTWATLMPLDTPILKVSRPVAACSRCRSAKIKCDGKLPACSSCEKNGRAAECTSTNDQFARGKERSYVSTLETRLDKLRTKIEQARARKPSVVSLADDDAATAVPSRRASRQALELSTRAGTNMRTKEATAIDDLVADFGFLSVHATARDFYGFTSYMSYARLVLSACSKEPLPDGMAKPLPARHEANTLVQHYLDNIFALIPVFDEASFYTSLECVFSKYSNQAEPFDHFMVRMVLAIASASMSEQRGDQRCMEALGHTCAALEHSEDVFHPGSISSVQAPVLLTEYAMLSPHHFDSWGLIGAASRAMVDLGLHQDPPKPAHMGRDKLELRRRLFYCIYTLDRSTSLVQSRAFSFSDDSAKVKMPFGKLVPGSMTQNDPAESKWMPNYAPALELIKIRKMQSAWYSEIFQNGHTLWDEPYPYIWDVCDDMRKWFEALPPSITSNMRAFFEMEYLYSLIYVLAPGPRVTEVNQYAQKLIFEYCMRYAELLLRLMGDPAYTAPLTFYDFMRVYMTGMQFLDVLKRNAEGLLNGDVPAPPKMKLTAAPPPMMPQVPTPPGESIQRVSTTRSIACIKQITECISKFGVRFGYMSWNQRFQNESSGLLDSLNIQLRDLDLASGYRRPSLWNHNSTGSATSSLGGSLSYSMPTQSATTPLTLPQQQQQSPPALAMPMHQGLPTTFGQSTAPSFFPVMPSYNLPSMGLGQSVQQTQPSLGQAYNFTPPPQPISQMQNSNFPAHPSMHSHPTHQFAAWQGYMASASGGPDTLDDENAVPPISHH